MKILKSETFRDLDKLTSFANKLKLAKDDIVVITQTVYCVVLWYYGEE
ncbi:hypothetical protein SAMN05216464_110214 [Mucilaginibacter pineti]|uniref:Uncharacterized protein n=1 Tax=Mucilaginibacter pineti TaxID=1391627 RepID=A0A1G7GMM1_9SPHI|nr:hypothetical protein SAMN05216464_110214 [Mucilaginibacter pineti]